MRLLIAASIFPPDIGGPASYVPELASSLVARGHQVEVVCLSDMRGGDDARYPFPVTRIRRAGPRASRMLAACRALDNAAGRADLLYANGLGVEAAWIGRRRRLAVVHKIVGDFAWERARNRGWFQGTLDEYQVASKEWRLRLLDRWRSQPLQRAAAVITPSAYLRAIVSGWGVPQTAISVVYNALPTEVARAVPLTLPPFDGSTVLTVCRLVPWKGVDLLIDVIAECPRLRLVVIGEGPLRTRLEAYADARGAAGRVIFLGARSPGEIEAAFPLADVFVLNSSYEGLPHVVLEAMRAGVPVVATAVGGTPEVVIDRVTGTLVRFGDQDALRGALLEAAAGGAAVRARAANARARLDSTFGYTAMVEQTERVLLGVHDAARAGGHTP
jgi:glycosyltransferase involved in cell wall biosynthesis